MPEQEPIHEQRDTDTHDRNPEYPSEHPEAVTNEEKAEQMASAENSKLLLAANEARKVGEYEVADILMDQNKAKGVEAGEKYDRELQVHHAAIVGIGIILEDINATPDGESYRFNRDNFLHSDTNEGFHYLRHAIPDIDSLLFTDAEVNQISLIVKDKLLKILISDEQLSEAEQQLQQVIYSDDSKIGSYVLDIDTPIGMKLKSIILYGEGYKSTPQNLLRKQLDSFTLSSK